MNTNFDFMRLRKAAMILSLLLIVVSVASIATRGLNLGLDFTGGTLLEVQYENAEALDKITTNLNNAGYRDVTVQNFGSETDVLVRMSEAFRDNLGNEVLEVLQQDSADNQLTLLRSEFVGAQVGGGLNDNEAMHEIKTQEVADGVFLHTYQNTDGPPLLVTYR